MGKREQGEEEGKMQRSIGKTEEVTEWCKQSSDR